MPDNLQFHVITILDIEHLHYKCCPNWNKSMYAQKKRSGNHRDMNILDISSHTNQKWKKFASNLPDLWGYNFWVVHYLTQITKWPGHQPKNPKLDKIQAAYFFSIIRKVSFSSLGGDWLNQSLGTTASLFQDQLLMKDSYLLSLSVYTLKFSKDCQIVMITYQIPGFCSAVQLSGKTFCQSWKSLLSMYHMLVRLTQLTFLQCFLLSICYQCYF